MAERRIIVAVATSADGYIARADGSVDWLDRPKRAGDYGMGEFTRSIDTILWGRKTYDMALGYMEKGIGGFDPKVKNYVFTHRPPAKGPAGVEFVSGPAGGFASRLRTTPGKDVWIMGGAGLVASFLDSGEIDRFIIAVIPTLIGEGIPLIAPRQRTVPLVLQSARAFDDGVVRLEYDVEKPATRRS